MLHGILWYTKAFFPVLAIWIMRMDFKAIDRLIEELKLTQLGVSLGALTK